MMLSTFAVSVTPLLKPRLGARFSRTWNGDIGQGLLIHLAYNPLNFRFRSGSDSGKTADGLTVWAPTIHSWPMSFGFFSCGRMLKTMIAVLVAALPIIPSYAAAATVNLDCSYERTLDVEKKLTSAAAGHLSVEIQFTPEGATKVTVNKSSRCDPRLAFVTDMEIGFACALDLPGQRISYTFTFDRHSGSLEQRFFFQGELEQIHYGRCKRCDAQEFDCK
jgi:hypothetical protein